MKNLKGAESIKPALLWKNFDRILGFPHPSKNETQLADFIFNFGKSLGLDTQRDEVGNVVIRKDASKAEFKNKPMVTLQSHIDMVPQKAEGKNFDFLKDTVSAFVDGNFVRADGTTLGADNGIGVATMMALLEAEDIPHGPIEAFFTIDEEAGMTGVKNLQPGFLQGKYLLNLDSEDEGQVFIGCAGGIDTTAFFNIKTSSLPSGFSACKISISGLKGGHSGCNIHEYRGNSIKILGRFLFEAKRLSEIYLSDIEGGTLRNVIPSKSFAVILYETSKEKDIRAKLDELAAEIKNEYAYAAPKLAVEIAKTDLPSQVVDKDISANIISAIHGCLDGVVRMDDNLPIVETSSNLAIVKKTESEITIKCLTRSSVDSARYLVSSMLEAVFNLAHANKVIVDGAYTGWKPNVNSELLKIVVSTHKDVLGFAPEVTAIHAGLECGLISAVYPEMDMVSIGPTIRDAHSINEHVDIKSVEKFFDLTCGILKNV